MSAEFPVCERCAKRIIGKMRIAGGNGNQVSMAGYMLHGVPLKEPRGRDAMGRRKDAPTPRRGDSTGVAYDNLHRLPEQLRRELAARLLDDHMRHCEQAVQPLRDRLGAPRATPHHNRRER